MEKMALDYSAEMTNKDAKETKFRMALLQIQSAALHGSFHAYLWLKEKDKKDIYDFLVSLGYEMKLIVREDNLEKFMVTWRKNEKDS